MVHHLVWSYFELLSLGLGFGVGLVPLARYEVNGYGVGSFIEFISLEVLVG